MLFQDYWGWSEVVTMAMERSGWMPRIHEAESTVLLLWVSIGTGLARELGCLHLGVASSCMREHWGWPWRMVWPEGTRGRACECSISRCSLAVGIGEALPHQALAGPGSAPFRPYFHQGLAAGMGKMCP